jgi:hypothetical protein
MKNRNIIILTLVYCIFANITAYAIPIVVTRTTTNGGANGYGHIYGFDHIVVDAGGNPMYIEQTIDCWDPGTDACPSKVFKTTEGSTVEGTINNQSVLYALEELAVKAIAKIDNENPTGNDYKHVCITINETTKCYLVNVNWTSSVNNVGKRTDVLTFDYIEIPTP